MKGIFQIISERIESFNGKRGKVEQRIVSLLDIDPENPMLNTADYVFNEEEKGKYSGKCQGKKVELAITGIGAAFGGRSRLLGHILSLS